MKIGVFVINLDRSVDRWQGLLEQANRFGIGLARIPGVNGKAIAPEAWQDVDRKRFRQQNGRGILPGEYGCYRSHIAALNEFLATDAEVAIIMEDDVQLPKDLIERTAAIFERLPEAEVVKLLNHRSHGFIRRATTTLGDEIGRCVHGPQGSAACYAVSRRGAQQLRTGLAIMADPFDIALERGWQNGARILSVKNNIASFTPESDKTEIGSRDDYSRVKLHGLKKTRTHIHRALEYARRIRYALC